MAKKENIIESVNESRPNEKGHKKGVYNADLIEAIEGDMGTKITSLVWANVSIVEKINEDGKPVYEMSASTDKEFKTWKELTDTHKNTLEVLDGIRGALEDCGKKMFLELIKSDNNYAQRLKLTEDFSVLITDKPRSSGKRLGAEVVKDSKQNDIMFYKYAMDKDKMSLNQMRTIWEGSEEMAKYQAAIAKAELERRNAEAAAKAAEEARKAQQKALEEAQKQNQDLMAQMAEIMARLAELENK